MYQLPLYAGILDFMATFAKKSVISGQKHPNEHCHKVWYI